MRQALYGFLIGFAFMLPAAASGQDWTGNVNAFLGSKVLEEDDWEPAEEHDEIGVLVDFRPTAWPVNLTLGYLRSDADESEFDPVTGLIVGLEAETVEWNLGVKKIWEAHSSVRPYVGGGLAHISAEATVRLSVPGLEVTVGPVDDSGIGYWVNGGVYWTLGGSFNIGVDLRYSEASVSLFDVDVEAGGGHAGVLLGYHW